MNAKPWNIGLLVVSSLLVALRAEARATGPFTMGIQETGTATSAELGPGITDKAVRLSVVEGRNGADLTVIGEISDHADKVFPLQISNDPIPWANAVLQKEAAASGLKVSPDASLSLTGKLVQLRLVASTKALGSTYSAQIQVAFTLADGKGRTLWQGTTEGGATRYGKERSSDNANEVLNDALREVYTNALGDSGLQSAWAGGKPVASSGSSASAAAPAAAAVSPSAMLTDLVKLKGQGFTTDLLVDYVNKRSLTKALSADDLVKWKNAGMPEEVIKAALARGGS
ncbi:MAG TPA: hypothetical protein VIE43_17415 [Thermoanaerobaculia bacterium]|nr:hypothetical protein [Thermoanaerobaculia bacterium]